jgi:hypothetical protein
MPMNQTHLNAEFWVEVKHRRPLPKRYTWEIHCKGFCLSVEESRGDFASWEEASQVGNKALRQLLQASQSRPVRQFFTRPRRGDILPRIAS